MNWLTGKDGKTCRICEEWKKLDTYPKNKGSKDGHRSECRECYRKDIQKHNKRRAKKVTKTTLIIPDIQAPYHHVDAVPFLKAVKEKYAPDEVVSIGDELDMYWLNAYGTDPDHDDPTGEYYQARSLWQEIFKIFPKGIGVKSNHVHGRMERKRKQSRLLSCFMKEFEDIIGAPEGWGWQSEYITQNTVCRHGHADGKSAKANLEKINHKTMFTDTRPLNLCLGHHHTLMGSTDVLMGQYIAWMSFSGSLIDRNRHAFEYTNKHPALGCGLIRDGRFFPVIMAIDENDRWIGELDA